MDKSPCTVQQSNFPVEVPTAIPAQKSGFLSHRSLKQLPTESDLKDSQEIASQVVQEELMRSIYSQASNSSQFSREKRDLSYLVAGRADLPFYLTHMLLFVY